MFDFNYFKQLLFISIIISSISCMLIQKTKYLFKSSKYIIIYSLIINIIISILFCLSFTNIVFPHNLWIGLFSFLEADSLYKSLEGKINSYFDIRKRKKN